MPKITTNVVVDYSKVDDYGWNEGTIEVQNVCQDGSRSYKFEAKVYGVPSHNGINNGRISKLYVTDIHTGTEVIGYDRGWYCKPHCPQEQVVLNTLLEIFDTPL